MEEAAGDDKTYRFLILTCGMRLVGLGRAQDAGMAGGARAWLFSQTTTFYDSQEKSPYVSAKRTHRFLEIVLMEHSLYVTVTLEMLEEIRWVRFGKRTQNRGVKRGVKRVFDPFLSRKWRSLVA
jgi:hypothetical protein